MWRKEETDQERARRIEALETAAAERQKFLIGKGAISPPYPDIDEEEFAALGGNGDAKRTALCLSGGGIRSATFSLGVLQALARLDWLRNFTYLSTVSGGGYIGSWLSGWIRRSGFETVTNELHKGKNDIEAREIQRLRANSSYLSPVRGLSGDFLTLISTFLRNLLINWAILIPLLIAVTLLPIMNVAAFSGSAAIAVEVSHAKYATAATQRMTPPPGAATPAVTAAALEPEPLAEDSALTPLHWLFLALFSLCAIVALAFTMADLPDGSAHQTKLNRFKLLAGVPVCFGAYFLSLGLVPLITGCSCQIALWQFAAGGAAIHIVAIGFGRAYLREKLEIYTPIQAKAVAADLAPWIPGQVPVPLRILWMAALSGAAAGSAIYGGVLLGRAGYVWLAGDDKLWPAWHAAIATFAVPYFLGIFFIGCALYVALIRRSTDDGAREWWGKSGGVWIAISAAWIILHIACVWLPALISYAGASAKTTGGVGAIAGVFVAIAGYFSKQTANPNEKQTVSFFEALNVNILKVVALGFIIVMFATAGLSIIDWSADLDLESGKRGADQVLANYFGVMDGAYWSWGFVTIAMIAAAVLASYVAGVNAFSMHAMYANRLVRAFLGASRQPGPATDSPQDRARRPHGYTGFDPDDDIAMADPGKAQRRPLFHVINVALNVVKAAGDRLEWQERKAASFTITPLRTGSGVTGYCRTRDVGGRGAVALERTRDTPNDIFTRDSGLTLGRAMAISGAAAAPNMGYHSSTLIAVVMTFFNVRLGWWMTNPARHEADIARMEKEPLENPATWNRLIKSMCSTEPRFPLRWLIAELFGATKADADSVYLSDGGHFDNLGLYEMVRRRCTSIVVVDAGCDPKYEFEDLERATRLIRNDLKVDISFPDGLPTEESIKRTRRHFVIGRIHYPNSPEGRILYIKPGLDGDEPLDVTRYAIRRRSKGDPFPHQSTADQFFDESQFESYRALGYYSVLGSMCPSNIVDRPKGDETNRVEEFFLNFAAPSAAAAAVTAAAATAAVAAVGSGLRGALSSIFSWDKLPGLLALLGIGVGADLATGKKADATDDAHTLITFPQASVPDDLDKVRDWTLLFDRGATLMLPLFAEGKICNPNDKKCDPGDRLDGASATLLRVLDGKLVACARDPQLPLKFTVRGMASTSEYKDPKTQLPLADSDERNLRLADQRAKVVYAKLPNARGLNTGDKEPDYWLTPGPIVDPALVAQQVAEMRKALYPDRGTVDDGAEGAQIADYGRGAGSMNRRVDIEFESLGTCKLLVLQQALQNSFPSASFRATPAGSGAVSSVK